MMGLDTPEACSDWRNTLSISCASSWFFFTGLYPDAWSTKHKTVYPSTPWRSVISQENEILRTEVNVCHISLSLGIRREWSNCGCCAVTLHLHSTANLSAIYLWHKCFDLLKWSTQSGLLGVIIKTIEAEDSQQTACHNIYHKFFAVLNSFEGFCALYCRTAFVI
jgi:hypothetical protein